jgi:four helix bundle protein
MENENLKTTKNLKYRSYGFSLDIIDLLELLPKNYIYQIIGKQLLRSATSIGANIIEAQAGRTKKDFANFYQIALKSANETKYWLSILKEKIKTKKENDKISALLKEAIAISKMLGASLITLKNNEKK